MGAQARQHPDTVEARVNLSCTQARVTPLGMVRDRPITIIEPFTLYIVTLLERTAPPGTPSWVDYSPPKAFGMALDLSSYTAVAAVIRERGPRVLLEVWSRPDAAQLELDGRLWHRYRWATEWLTKAPRRQYLAGKPIASPEATEWYGVAPTGDIEIQETPG